MIRLFRQDGLELMLNIDMIKDIEPGPPVLIRLLNGETLSVKNTLTDVLVKIKAHRLGVDAESHEFDPVAGRKGAGGRKPPAP